MAGEYSAVPLGDEQEIRRPRGTRDQETRRSKRAGDSEAK
jgi:hypothetical protein